MNIKERILKDSFEREAPLSMDVTKVVVDTRATTHDIVAVYVRLAPVGRLVCDKTDSITIARRLLPDTLRYDKEPSSLMLDMTKLVTAYYDLLVEARIAVSTGSANNLAKHLRGRDDSDGMAAIPPEFASLLLDRQARREAEVQKPSQSPAG